jgi:hypothetical protein
MIKNKRKALYIFLGIIGFILVLAGSASLWVSYHYKGILMARIPVMVSENTDGLYKVEVGDISINIITRKITIRNVHFYADPAKIAELKQQNICPRTTYNFTVPEAVAHGINWRAIIADHNFKCGYITINNPATLFEGRPRGDTSRMKKNDKKPLVIQAGKIYINNPDITYSYKDDSTQYSLRVKGGKVELTDWLLDTKKGLDTGSFLFAHNSVVNFDSFFYKKENGAYNMSSAGIGFSTGQRDLTLEHMELKLVGKKEDFYKRVGEQKEIYDFHFPRIRFSGLNWKDLINGRQLETDTMTMYDPELSLYFSRKYPASKTSKVGNYPHQLLRSMGLKTNIRHLLVNNGTFKYTEENEITNKEATITFEGIKGVLKNVTNIDTIISKNDKCTIALDGRYQQNGRLTANFVLSLSDPKGFFTLDGSAKNIHAEDINQTTKTLALTEVRAFNMSRLDMHIEGDQTYGKGSVTMLYDGLELAFLKISDENNKADSKGLGMLSFLANKLALYPANPMPGKEVRHMTTYVKRDAYKGFFNLIWKNIFQGAKNTALRTPDLVANIQEKRNPEKKGILKKIFGKKR